MSLTTFYENNVDVRERFKKEFKKPRFSAAGHKMVAQPITTNYGTVATAFDYLLRFLVQQLNPQTKSGPWIAEIVVKKLLVDKPELRAKGEKIVSRARQDLADFLKGGQVSDELLESALLLATLDPIRRKRVGYEFIGVTNKDDIQDLKQLLQCVDRKNFTTDGLSLVNPSFGPGSTLVGGADCDLVIGDTLIDIKAVKNLELDRGFFDQVIGYYVLHHIGGVAKISPKPQITKVAIYFVRFAYLHVMQLSEIINQETFPEFVQWFQNRATEIFAPARKPEDLIAADSSA